MKHRTAVVTAASVAGVLLVGAAALGANLGVLGSNDLGSLSAVDPPQVVTVTDPAASPSTTPASPSTATSPEVLAFNVPGAGIVTLERAGDELSVAGVELVSGWTSEVVREGSDVVISLTGDRTLTFSAVVVGGEVSVSVDEVPPPSPAGVSAPSGEHEESEGESEWWEHEESEHEGWGDDD